MHTQQMTRSRLFPPPPFQSLLVRVCCCVYCVSPISCAPFAVAGAAGALFLCKTRTTDESARLNALSTVPGAEHGVVLKDTGVGVGGGGGALEEWSWVCVCSG